MSEELFLQYRKKSDEIMASGGAKAFDIFAAAVLVRLLVRLDSNGTINKADAAELLDSVAFEKRG